MLQLMTSHLFKESKIGLSLKSDSIHQEQHNFFPSSTGFDWESLDFDCGIMIQDFTRKREIQKKISILETPTSDFVISLVNRFLDKPRKDTVCSREQCLTVVFCGPFSANYARACKTAFLVRKVFQILSQISTHKIKTKCK